jgi:VIT1/CCC1 family predicted Fe2+/Mn2+ transporter
MEKIERFLPDFVYGGIDGTITTFAIATGAFGAQLPIHVITILGIASLFADGFSMAVSRYLSAETEEEMMGDERPLTPLTSAIVTFISFVVVGFIPLKSFLIGHLFRLKSSSMFYLAYVLTGIALFLVGFLKGYVLDRDPGHDGLITLTVGGVAAVISYMVGRSLRHWHK